MTKKEASAILTLVSLGYTVKGPETATAPEVAPEPVGSLAQRMAPITDSTPDPLAPHGRDAEGTPLAPFGWLADLTRPRKTAAGRPQLAAPVATPAAVAAPAVAAFSLDLSDFGGAPAPVPAAVTPDSVFAELTMDLGKL